MKMNEKVKNNSLILQIIILNSIPILFWISGDFPNRTVLKEFLSILFILSFCMMLGLFYLNHINTIFIKNVKMSKTLKFHKFIGYFCVSVFLLHPFLIVVPRFFESGVTPLEAFITIITTINNSGIVVGIIAWCLILIMGITSFYRNEIPIKDHTWKKVHGILSILFIILAAWHVIDLGRHANWAISGFIIILAISGVWPILRNYILDQSNKRKGL